MGIVRFALRFPYTFYVLAAFIVFVGVSAGMGDSGALTGSAFLTSIPSSIRACTANGFGVAASFTSPSWGLS